MIYYAVFLLLVRVVLATSNRTFDECMSYCLKWDKTSEPYACHCENSSVDSCFDELTRNVPAKKMETLIVHELEFNGRATPAKIEYPLVHGAKYYLLKHTIYDPHSNFTPITAYDVRPGRVGQGSVLFTTEDKKNAWYSSTVYRDWMANVNTTYEYYLRTYSNQKECNESKQHMNETTDSNRARVLSITFGTVILLILVLIATGMVVYKRRSQKKHSRKKRFNESMELREERYHDMIRCPSDDDIFEIDCERVVIFKDQVLGQGAFGKVYKGRVKGLARTSFHATSKLTDDQELAENMLVAVKQCYEFADATTKREFIREIEIMKELYQHESLVNILYCITQYPHKPFSLIVEYCEHGDLLKFLQNSKVYLEKLKTDEPDNEKIILFDDVAQITFEVADGMTYLAEKGYVHRDLAARNIMVKKGKHVKIGDFGLCRSVVSQHDVYTTKGGKLPIKWMAIESLYDYQFSTKSDVWSYGVLLYEVTTLGLQPYADVVPQDGDFRRAMIAHLRSGARLEQPLSCPDEIYAIITRTWAEKPEDRASFAEIREKARILVESLHDLDGGVYGDRYVGVEVNRCDQSDGEELCLTAE